MLTCARLSDMNFPTNCHESNQVNPKQLLDYDTRCLLGGTVKCDRPIAEGRLCSIGRGWKKTNNTLVTSSARHQSSFTVCSLMDDSSRR
jgi:hypothetical protein